METITEHKDTTCSQVTGEAEKCCNMENDDRLFVEISETSKEQLEKDNDKTNELSDTWTPLDLSNTQMDVIERMDEQNTEEHEQANGLQVRRRKIKVTPNLKFVKNRLSRKSELIKTMRDVSMEKESAD